MWARAVGFLLIGSAESYTANVRSELAQPHTVPFANTSLSSQNHTATTAHHANATVSLFTPTLLPPPVPTTNPPDQLRNHTIPLTQHTITANVSTTAAPHRNYTVIANASTTAASHRSLLSIQALHVDPATYFVNGGLQSLYPMGSTQYPIRVYVQHEGVGEATVALQGLGTHLFRVDYNNADGSINSIQPLRVDLENSAFAETQLTSILTRAQQLAFEPNGGIRFIADNGNTRFSALPMSDAIWPADTDFETRVIQPSTYYVQGQFQSLYNDAQFQTPILLESQIVDVGRIRVVVRGLSAYQYEISYNNADGWVNNVNVLVEPGYQSGYQTQQFLAEQRIAEIVRKVQRIAFENDGRIQFIADNGLTRCGFDPVFGSSFATPLRYLSDKATLALLKVVPNSYMANSTFYHLFDGDLESKGPMLTLKTTLLGSNLTVELNYVGSFIYTMERNNTGKVSNVTLVSKSEKHSPLPETEVQNKINNILTRVEQVNIEKDGRTEFVTDHGNSRISFDPLPLDKMQAAHRALQAVETRQIVPSTYFVNGQFQKLFIGADTIPITLESEVVYGGLIKVLVQAVNYYNYQITYNNADGWVNKVTFISRSYGRQGTYTQMDAEHKVINIISRTQQIAFEKDGRIQFITDNGSTRVSFDRTPTPVYSPFATQEPVVVPVVGPAVGPMVGPAVGSVAQIMMNQPRYLQATPDQATRRELKVVPETYTKDGVIQSLFKGEPKAIIMRTVLSNSDFFAEFQCGVQVVYAFKRQPNDGWVTHSLQLFKTFFTNERDTAVIDKLTDLIGNAQQISIEQNGRTQFISNGGKNRISFDPVSLA